MLPNDQQYYLFLNDEESATPSSSKRLYFHLSSCEEDDVSNTLEGKETALAAYEQAIQLAPHEAMLHYHKGLLLEQLGRYTEADAAYEDAHRLGYQRPVEAKVKSALIDA